MANTTVAVKAKSEQSILKILVIALLIVGVATLALALYDMISGFSLIDNVLSTADATDLGEQSDLTGRWAGYVLLLVSAALVIGGAVVALAKDKFRLMQNLCIAAIVFAIFPLVYFLVICGKHLFSLAYAILCIAIIVLTVFTIRGRWRVYLKEMTGEVKKLTWLTFKDLVKNTCVVLVFVVAFAVLIFALDWIFGKPISLLLTSNDAVTTTTQPTEAPTDDGAVATDDAADQN